jgi:hypothetical protein
VVDGAEPARWLPIIPLLREFETYLAAGAPRLEIINVR